MTILVIEDSRFLPVLIERSLLKAGYRAIRTADGEAGLRVAREQIPDLILLDIMLPKLPGTHVLRVLKNNPTTARIPVVALSGLSRKNDEKLISEGADAYFEKSSLGLDKGADTLIAALQTTLIGMTSALKPPQP